jgi:hypothetical protein
MKSVELASTNHHIPFVHTGNNNTLTRTARYYLSPRWLGTGIIVLFVMAVACYAEFVFVNFLFLPQLNTTLGATVNASDWFTCIVWHFMWTNMMVSYLRCIFTEPGSVPIAWVCLPDGCVCVFRLGSFRIYYLVFSFWFFFPVSFSKLNAVFTFQVDSVPSMPSNRSQEEEEKVKTVCFKCTPNNLKPERAHHCMMILLCLYFSI